MTHFLVSRHGLAIVATMPRRGREALCRNLDSVSRQGRPFRVSSQARRAGRVAIGRAPSVRALQRAQCEVARSQARVGCAQRAQCMRCVHAVHKHCAHDPNRDKIHVVHYSWTLFMGIVKKKKMTPGIWGVIDTF